MNKATTFALALIAGLTIGTAASAQSDNAFEKKSYNYAEWAKGRFSEVVTVRNPGKIIYLGGVGAQAIVLRNEKGAVLRLTGRQVGLQVNLDLSGLSISMR